MCIRDRRKTAAAGAATPVSGTVAPAKSVPLKPARSPEEEIALRKARRRLHRMLAASLVVVVGLCLAGAGDVYKRQGVPFENKARKPIL